MKKILPTKYPIIHGWAHYAHLLLMLQGNPNSFEYIYSNYVQLYFGLERNEVRCDFYFQYPFTVGFFDKCNFILSNRRRKNVICNSKENILAFIKEELKNNFFIRIFMDHKYIKSFSTNNHHHDCLIYGIDEEYLYVADVFQKGIYSQQKIPIDEALNSILNCNLSNEEDYMMGCVESYKVHDNIQYHFDLKNFNNQIVNYYNSVVPEYWTFFESSKINDYKFGLSIYNGIKSYIKNIIESNLEIDRRILYAVKDHKTMMCNRISYLQQHNICSNPILSEMGIIYQELEKEIDEIIFLCLIYNRKIDDKYCNKIIKKIQELYKKEKSILNKYITENKEKN